jgi:hypothetical protein
VVVKLYNEKIFNNRERSIIKLQEQMERLWKKCARIKCYFAFCKHLPIYDPTPRSNFRKEIQIHYDMNFELEMLMKKL